MHKQFQKFGLFVSKNSKDETNPKIDDKYVKYLYKKESESTKRKIKSANDTETDKFGKRQSQENKSRSNKISSNSLRKLLKKNNVSETEIFFISPEDIKRHRKKLRQNNEKSPERRKHSSQRPIDNIELEKQKTQKREEDIAKMIKQQKYKSEDDYQWLTKPEVYKLLNNAKEDPKNSSTSNFLKKFFVFDRDSKEKTEFIPVHEKQKKSHRSHDENKHKQTNSFIASGSSTLPRKEKNSKNHDKKSRDKSIEIMYKNESKNKNERKKSASKDRENHQKHNKKSTAVPDELLDARKIKTQSKSRSQNKTDHSKLESESKTKIKKSLDLKKKILDENKQTTCNINPERHKHCLVKHTFPIVEIYPFIPPNDNTLEKKKRLKAFKKYYKYNSVDKDSEITVSSNGYACSDSHKMYQEITDLSADEKSIRKRKYEKAGSSRGSELKIETNVSSIIINPEPQNIITTKTEERKTTKHSQKSKIPIFNNNPKLVELARNVSPGTKYRKKTEEIFKDKERNQDEFKKEEETNRSKIPVSKSFNEKSSIEEKFKNIKPSKYQSTSTQNNIIIKTKEKSTGSKIDSNDLRLSGISSSSRMSNSDKQSARSYKRTLSRSPPGTYRKPTIDGKDKGVKSPSKLSQDGASSVWSKNSKKSTKSPYSSKSDTRIKKNKKPTNNQKGKSFERSSARTSISNSTCGDKSVDSKNGTSFLLTKNYRDDDKLNRWQKRKMYADVVRKNAISKGQKSSVVPPQVVEIRYFTTVTTDNVATNKPVAKQDSSTEDEIKSTSEVKNDLPLDDLPNPCFELVENQKFQEIFQSPVDDALNEILNQNYVFLQKDFSINLNDIQKLSSPSSSDDITSNDLISPRDSNEWYDFKISHRQSLSELSCCRRKSDLVNPDINLGSQEQIVDSLSAPGSEESGYATVKTRSFFDRPNIKALLHPTKETCLDYNVEIEIEKSSSKRELEIRSIESKSLQTYMIATSHKSVQIKLSPEEIDFSEQNQDKKATPRDEIIKQNNSSEETQNQNTKIEVSIDNTREEEEVEISNYIYENNSLITKQEKQLNLEKIQKHNKKKKFLKLLSSLSSCVSCKPSNK